MVEVVSSEEFSEFMKNFEERLAAIESKLDELVKSEKENRAQTKVDLEKAVRNVDERIDDLAESSKGFVERLREAFNPRVVEPLDQQEGSTQREKTEKTIGKVAEIISNCPNFFNWDFCQDNCPSLYQLCDSISAIQDPSKLSQKTSTERFRDLVEKFASNNYFKSEEYVQ